MTEPNSKRCSCVYCDTCHGLGYLFDPLDYETEGFEQCPEDCEHGIVEKCRNCEEREEFRDEEWL